MKHLNLFNDHRSKYFSLAIAICLTSFSIESSAQIRSSVYKPTVITSGVEVNDILTDTDIPTGQKGFARDYAIAVQKMNV